MPAPTPTPSVSPSVDTAPASMAPSDAPTLKMGTVDVLPVRVNRKKARWARILARRDLRRQHRLRDEAAIQHFSALDVSRNCTRPPAEPPPRDVSSASEDDSLFFPPPLAYRCDYSSSDDSISCDSTDTSFCSAQDSTTVSTASSVHSGYSSLGPPPPGSLMSLWDTPFSTSCLHDFHFRSEDSKCTLIPPLETSSVSSSSLSSACFTNDDDSYASLNPLRLCPVLSLTRVEASPPCHWPFRCLFLIHNVA
jgi:hypothetical protein